MSYFLFISLFLVALPPMEGVGVNEYDPRYGTFVGQFKTLHHGVVGDVYAVDNITIFVKGFSYDGEAPDAFFFAGNKGAKPSNKGFVIPDENGRKDPLGPYRKRDLVLKFPITTRKGQRSFNDIKWISVWCRKFAIDFGYVQLPLDLKVPKAEGVGGLKGAQSIAESSNVIMEDSETITVKDFSYDGSVPDAIFVMGSGSRESDAHQVPNERGSTSPLSRYNRKQLSLKLPKSSAGKHIQYFGIWSPTKGMITSVNFPHEMRIPPSL